VIPLSGDNLQKKLIVTVNCIKCIPNSYIGDSLFCTQKFPISVKLESPLNTKNLRIKMSNNKISLPQVTLVTVSSVHFEDTLDALKYCFKGIEFGSVKFITHFDEPQGNDGTIEYCKCDKITSLDEYSRFMIYELHKYIDTEYCLTIHRDGVVLNPTLWQNRFFEYDYIGAPWPIDNAFKNIDGGYSRIGNGGFSFRSKRFLELPSQLNIPYEPVDDCFHEDVLLCVKFKKELESHGIKYADIDVAKYFAHELKITEIKGIKPFGFHQYKKQNKRYPRFPSKWKIRKQKFKTLFLKS